MSGLFSTFNIAKRGMFVQQKAIDVTSHNIANANTEGYSRQRATIETTRPFGTNSMYAVSGPGQLGTGAEISTIERVRDTFLDYQIRVETSTQGQYSARERYLTEVESIFNEPTDSGLASLFSSFYNSWQELSKHPESSNSRTVVAQQSSALADELNHTYTQLEKLKGNAQDEIKNTVVDINSILDQLNTINQQIKQVKVADNMPNDLMDKRDLLIDELSSKFDIEVEKTAFEGVNIKAASGSNGVEGNLVNSVQGGERRFSYINDIKKVDGSDSDYTITYYKLGDVNKPETVTVSIANEEEFKNLDQTRVLWADSEGNPILNDDGGTFKLFTPDSGEVKGYQSIQKDIDEYKTQLNNVAKALAFAVNSVHSGTTSADSDSMPFFVNSSAAKYNSDNTMYNPSEILTGETEITAENISVNKEIMYDVMKIKAGVSSDSGESDGSRALAIAQLKNTMMKIQSIKSDTNRSNFITLGADGMTVTNETDGMKIDNYFKDTVDKLGVQTQEASRIVKNQNSLLQSFNESKLSVSGVSLDEEMANLVQFQHAYQANAKMISTIDELLDVVVNGLKK